MSMFFMNYILESHVTVKNFHGSHILGLYLIFGKVP